MTLYLPPCPVAGCNRVGIIGDSAPRLCWRHANEAAGGVIVAPPTEPVPRGRPVRPESRPWTTPEEDRLRDLWARGVKTADIGRVLGNRSEDAIQKHARYLKLERRPMNPKRSK